MTTGSRRGSSSPIVLHASTLIPTPQPYNRHQHVAFLQQYLGGLSSSSSSWAVEQSSSQLQQQQQQQQQLLLLQQQQRRCCLETTSTTSNSPDTTTTATTTTTTTTSLLSPAEASYMKRREQWAAKYTTVEALRRTFGTNRNVMWGDLDAKTTRRLYKTLLPRALLELHCHYSTASTTSSEVGTVMFHPEDLAPLAYQARVAAKLYARERCHLPARIAAHLYDGIRQYTKYGTFNCRGMSYQQIWEKYATVILHDADKNSYDLTVDDVTAKICMKILERSCQTNAMVDHLVKCHDKAMSSSSTSCDDDVDHDDWQEDLKFIAAQLEADAKSLLQPYNHYDEEDDDNSNVSSSMLSTSSSSSSEHVYTSSALLLSCSDYPHKSPIMIYDEDRMKSVSSSSVPMNHGDSNTEERITTSRGEQQQQRFQQQKLRLIRSIVRMKRKFEKLSRVPTTKTTTRRYRKSHTNENDCYMTTKK